MAKYGMAIDLHRCVGCGACALACKNENNTEVEKFGKRYNWADFLIKLEGTFAQGNLKYLTFPTLCNHCDVAPCIETCPVSPKALYKTGDGITMINHERCVGCGFCVESCPYSSVNINSANVQYSVITQNARWYDNYETHSFYDDTMAIIPGCTHSPAEVVQMVGERPPDANLYYHPDTMDVRVKDKCEKCTFCDHRVTIGLEPACVEACPAHARMFGDLNDPSSEIREWIKDGYVTLKNNKGDLAGPTEQFGHQPNVFYIGNFGPVGIEEVKPVNTPSMMKVYPNPAKTVTTVEFIAESSGLASIAVFDTSGKQVMALNDYHPVNTGSNNFSINVAPLSPGTYILRILTGKQVMTANLLIKR